MAKASIQFKLGNSDTADRVAVLIPPAIHRTEGFDKKFLRGILFKDITGEKDISVADVKFIFNPADFNLVPGEGADFVIVGDLEKPSLSILQQFLAAYDVAVTGAAVLSKNGEQYSNPFSKIVAIPGFDAYKKSKIVAQADANGGLPFNPEKGLLYNFAERLVLNGQNRDTGLAVTIESESSVTITLEIEVNTPASPAYL